MARTRSYRRWWFRLLVLHPLLLLATVTPASLTPRLPLGPHDTMASRATSEAPAVADFVPPMTAREAAAVVAKAQRDEQKQRLERSHQAGSATSASKTAPAPVMYFSQTGHHLDDRVGFLSFWRTHGGRLVFGYPISEELVEDGRVRQYFERARFEYHPQQPNPEYRVQLALLGVERTVGRFFPTVEPGNGDRYFAETGHSMSGAFYQFWLKRGGLPVFGFPISEPIQEVSPVDGQTYTVQYFERARFEHHPEDMDPFYRNQAQTYGLKLMSLYEVGLGDLGRQIAEHRGYRFARSDRQATATEWSPRLWPRRIDVNLSTQHLAAFEGDTEVFRAPVATGADGYNTPAGKYAIYDKYPMQTMAGSIGWDSWYVPDVPWVQYIVGGVALHGTYWHDKWGTGVRMSHGCINLNIDDAEWLYGWADIGTQVNVFY